MVVADSVHVVIARDVERDTILVEDRVSAGRCIFCRKPAASDSVDVQPNVYRVTRVELEEAPKRPTAQGVPNEASFRLKEGHLIGHIELISVAVVFCTPSVG